MKTVIQYDFFETREESEWKALEQKMEELDNSCHKIRKGIFAKHSELLKRQLELEARLEILEKHICKGDK